MIVGSYDDVIADRCVQRRIINEEPVCEPKAGNSVAVCSRHLWKFFEKNRAAAWKMQGQGGRVGKGDVLPEGSEGL